LNGYSTAITRQQQKIQYLEKEIHDARERSGSDQLETPIDRIFHDLNKNKKAHPSARCYSHDTIIWARKILSLSPTAYRMIRQILPLPSERLLERNSVDAILRVHIAPTHLDSMDSLIDIWREANHIEGNVNPVP
jgi:hypothetical protein